MCWRGATSCSTLPKRGSWPPSCCSLRLPPRLVPCSPIQRTKANDRELLTLLSFPLALPPRRMLQRHELQLYVLSRCSRRDSCPLAPGFSKPSLPRLTHIFSYSRLVLSHPRRPLSCRRLQSFSRRFLLPESVAERTCGAGCCVPSSKAVSQGTGSSVRRRSSLRVVGEGKDLRRQSALCSRQLSLSAATPTSTPSVEVQEQKDTHQASWSQNRCRE